MKRSNALKNRIQFRWSVLTVFTLLSALIFSSYAFSAEKDSFCDYMVFLEQPMPRADFLRVRKDSHSFNQLRSDPDSRHTLIRSSDIDKNMDRHIDEVSLTCLGCHDEMGGMIKKDPKHPKSLHGANMSSMSISHRIGIDYEKKSVENKGLKSSADFPENVMLVNGGISCVTCHDPFNKKGNHLVSKDRASLCFICHNM